MSVVTASAGASDRVSASRPPYRLSFDAINCAALSELPGLVQRWLPNGRRKGREWVALNPKRRDKSRGSFKINLRTGRWSDFATGDKGGDVVSLVAYLAGIRQSEAALQLAEMLRVSPWQR
jgi:hypothetical protein